MSELRQDIVSGDWVIISPARAARPILMGDGVSARKPGAGKAACPFEDLEKTENWPPIVAYPSVKKWRTIVIPNKYPALTHGDMCMEVFRRGPYRAATGVGECELVITRSHSKMFTALSPAELRELFRAFIDRHRAMAKDPCLSYVTTFLNLGASAGGSLAHPHYQIIALPFIAPHAAHSFHGEARYFAAHRRCVRCDMVSFERAARVRVIAENASAIAFAPYASKRAFEVAVLPKKHFPSFAATPERVICDTAALLQSVMKSIKRKLNNPDLNFFIHDAPIDGKKYPHHHWHIELMPNLSLLGGFEFSTGVYVNTIDPERAAKILRGK